MKIYNFLILFVFLASCVATNTGPETMSKYKVQKGQNKLSVKKNFFYTSATEDPFNVDAIRQNKYFYDPSRKIEILYPRNETVFLLFTDVNTPVNCVYWPCDYGDGFFDSTHYSLKAAKDYANKKFGQPTFSSTSTGNFTTSIGRHKNTCKDLGFIPGTEKFGECAIKLIEIEVVQQGNANSANQIQIIQQQPAYDGWMGELGLSILRGDFDKKVQQPTYRFPKTQTSTCRWQNNGIAQPTLNCTTNPY